MKQVELKLDSGVYTLKELTVREIRPIMKIKDGVEMNIELLRKCVSLDGIALGDKIQDMAFTEFQELLTEANELHGFTAPEADDDRD